MVKPLSSKNTKISQVWWHKPVVVPTQEVEARESLEPRRGRGCTKNTLARFSWQIIRKFDMITRLKTYQNWAKCRGQGRWMTRSRDQDHPDQHGETPPLVKVGGSQGQEIKTILANTTGRFPAEKPRGSPVRLFWPAWLFCQRPVRRFPVRSVRDGRARLVPPPQGKQQLEALRTEFHSGRSEPGKVWLRGEPASAKGKLRNRKTSSPGGERSKMAA
ncbi:hypothetical protein AAY473_026527 [Plecturocebus cupreus]